MHKNVWYKVFLVSIVFPFFLLFVLQIDSFARVGGSRSSGFRGSRTYSAPTRTAPTSPTSPTQSYQQPTAPTQPAGGGFFRNMMGGLVGGMIGSMLFRGLGFGGTGGWGGGGIGLFEILLLAAVLFFVYRFIKKRREQAAGTYYQSSAYGTTAAGSTFQQPYDTGYAPGPDNTQLDRDAGLRYIRQMDPAFDEVRFGDLCMDSFFKIQGAWANRDMSTVRNLLTDEMYRTIQGDADQLKTDRKINKLDNIAVRTTDITEAWQESGKDYITVRFYANLLDYTVDEATGSVVSGSKTDPVKFEEYWTFTRPVGSNPWQLSAITQP